MRLTRDGQFGIDHCMSCSARVAFSLSSRIADSAGQTHDRDGGRGGNSLRAQPERRPAKLLGQYPVGLEDPGAEQRPGVARIDEVLHAEPLGRAERRADSGQFPAKTLGLGVPVSGLLELGPERGLDAAAQRQRTKRLGLPR